MLAMSWRKYNQLINNTSVTWSDIDLDDLLAHALSQNAIHCIEMLIDYGASFDRVRRCIDINNLYSHLVG